MKLTELKYMIWIGIAIGIGISAIVIIILGWLFFKDWGYKK